MKKKINLWDERFKEKKYFLKWPDEMVVRFLAKNNGKQNQKVLDLGCGSGRHCELLIKQGYQPIKMTLPLKASYFLNPKLKSTGPIHVLARMKSMKYKMTVMGLPIMMKLVKIFANHGGLLNFLILVVLTQMHQTMTLKQ